MANVAIRRLYLLSFAPGPISTAWCLPSIYLNEVLHGDRYGTYMMVPLHV